MSDLDDAIFSDIIFALEGAVPMTWEVASRCTCYDADTEQPDWNHQECHGSGVLYAAPVSVVGLFRSQSRWISPRREGELEHGEASVSFPTETKPSYVDRRVRDRFTVVQAQGDMAAGTVFYPAGQPTPFIFDGEQLAWRVQLQMVEQNQRLVPN
jgi:hypothetical protein